ncbi:MAG: FkbM family methyltransferase [Pirellula sp.]|jgi:FkbM family methyltransferase|nr:FkbM family methyltransferase [Pirellula sp.]
MAISEYNVAVETRYGRMLVNKNDIYIGRSLVEYGDFSFGEVQLFQQFVPSNGIVVEAGANIGAHTLFFAKHLTAGAVYAIEAQRLAFQTLCGNMALNSVSNAICYWAAVGSANGTMIVPVVDYSKPNNFGGLNLHGHSTGDRVPVLLIDELQLQRCDLIKADVEGMEEDVLRGATKTIDRFRPVLYLESDREDKRSTLFELIRAMGYRLYWHTPPLFSPDNFRGSKHNSFGELRSFNVLCIHASIPQNIQGMKEI